MGQIVRRKKKGRPSKAFLAHRSAESPAPSQPDLRRSLRRRNVRYNIEYDDYLDEDDEDEDEDERRREKKLKLVVKLNQDRDRDEDESAPGRTRSVARGSHSRDSSDEDEGERKPLKKRRIGGGGRVGNEDGEEEEEEEEEGGEDNDEENEIEEDENVRDHNDDDDDGVKGRKVDSKGLHSVSGTPGKSPSLSGIPLPDKRTLELILDKLQKKDTYGVYAEPVDPEELPDYHDVIEHPMDFATVRKKLANGSYPTLEQFESDVFLICANAMQYNSAETIYHKQARAIQELARKKFEKLRVDFEHSQSELKSDQKARSNSLGKKPTKKSVGLASQEPVGSDFSAGATLANIGDVLPTSHPIPGSSCERPCTNDGFFDVNGFFIDVNQERAEDFLSGKSLLSKLGRKPCALEDNRRGTYSASIQPVAKSDSVLMTFESEIKQLVTVGLHADYSYSRSLARFAATLGPVAWKIASRRIQQALPSGCKFGRGWVGEYEPLPTPVIMLDNRIHKEPNFFSKFQSTESGKDDKNGKTSESSLGNNVHGHMLEGNQPSIDPASRPTSEGKPSLFGSAGIRPNASVNVLYQQQNAQPRSSGKPENKGMKQVELNSLPSSNQNNANIGAKFLSNAPHAGVSKPREMVPRNMNILPSAPFKEPDANGATATGDLPNGKVANSNLNRRPAGSPAESSSSQTGRAGPFVSHGQDQSLTDPVQLMRMLAEKAQKQQASSNPSPVDTPPMTPSVSSGRRDDSGNAAAAAARAWMSVGAGGFRQGTENSSSPKSQISADSLYNPSREFHQHIPRTRGEFPPGGMPFQPEKNNFPFQSLVSQPIHPGSVSQFPNRPMVFPQLAAADLSRFQMQSAWQGLSPHSQPRQKPETLPPDLNIGFQPPGSPAKQSPSVMVDSQQPDLALQL